MESSCSSDLDNLFRPSDTTSASWPANCATVLAAPLTALATALAALPTALAMLLTNPVRAPQRLPQGSAPPVEEVPLEEGALLAPPP
jgi:hypothetical protein